VTEVDKVRVLFYGCYDATRYPRDLKEHVDWYSHTIQHGAPLATSQADHHVAFSTAELCTSVPLDFVIITSALRNLRVLKMNSKEHNDLSKAQAISDFPLYFDALALACPMLETLEIGVSQCQSVSACVRR
jgi:hypothetical protein